MSGSSFFESQEEMAFGRGTMIDRTVIAVNNELRLDLREANGVEVCKEARELFRIWLAFPK